MAELHFTQWESWFDAGLSWGFLWQEKKNFSHINVSSLSIALSFQQLQPCPAALSSTDCSYLQPDLLRTPLASAGITYATPRKQLILHIPTELVLPPYPYPEKGKNTSPPPPWDHFVVYTVRAYHLCPFPLFQPFFFFFFFFPFNSSSNWFCNVRDDDSWSRGSEMSYFCGANEACPSPCCCPGIVLHPQL